MSDPKKRHLLKALNSGIRYDGRALDSYRDIKIEYGVSETAEGSAKITIGNTTIIAGVKLSVEKPYSDTPEDGNLMVGAEFLPLASQDFEAGPPSIDAIELARVIDRGIREGHAIDTKTLCIEPGEKVWTVSVDICIVNADGNLFDAAGLAALAALKDTKYPELKEDGSVDYKHHSDKGLELHKSPVAITLVKIEDHILVDPLPIEEELMDARLTVTSLEDGSICALQKGGKVPLSIKEISDLLDVALEKAQYLRAMLN